MKKLMMITAAMLLAAGFATAPAFAQAAATKTMPMKTMAKKSAHARSCYDYAWDSQAQKDCLAGKSSKPMAKKASAKKSTKKAAPKKT